MVKAASISPSSTCVVDVRPRVAWQAIMQNDLSTLRHFIKAVGIKAPIYKVRMAANHSRQCYTLNYTRAGGSLSRAQGT